MTATHDIAAAEPMLGPMSKPPISSALLSAEMARALAASCPPLKTADVVNVADSLTARAKPTRVIGHLLLHGADLMEVRRVVEALRALRDVAA
jgi:hypothetical protein